MSDAESFDAQKVANLTLLQLRRIDERMTTMLEIVIRQDERLARLERDFGEQRRDVAELRRDISKTRSEMVVMKNRVLNQVQRILNEVTRMEERAMS